MIKNFVNFLLSPNLVISYYIYQIRHLIIISALEKKAKRDRLRQFEKNPIQRAKCQTNPYQKTTEHPLQSEKKINPRDGVFSQTIKQKTNPFFPPLKTEISLKKSNEKLFALFCSCEFVLVINLSRQKKTENIRSDFKNSSRESNMTWNMCI